MTERQQGFANAFAGIVVPNPASVALHGAVGMRLIGVYKGAGWKLGAWHDVAWYEMRLGEPPLAAGREPIEPVGLLRAGRRLPKAPRFRETETF
jgi:hypothetical protein